MDVEVISGDAFGDVEADWADLAGRDPTSTPFQTAAWAGAWLAHWNLEGAAWILRVSDVDGVRGIVPLTVTRRRGARVLGMLGKEPGDYWDVLAAEGDREAVAAAAAGELLRRSSSWDVGLLNCMPPGSTTAHALGAAGLTVAPRAAVRSPHIPLPDTFDAYLASLPGKKRSNLRKHLRKLEVGEVTMRAVTGADDIHAAMLRWRELRSRQWKAAGREINPLHERDAFTAFMTEAACRMIPRGTATLWEFEHEGQVAGVFLNFHDDRAFYWYLGGFEPELAPLGIGKIAIAVGIRDSIEAGRSSFDFTRGNESYKYWYGAVDRELESVVVGHAGLRSRLAVGVVRSMLARRGTEATSAD